MRRFLLHVLPRGFQRLRHFGFLANRRRCGKLARCRQLLGAVATASDTNPLPRDYQSLYETVTGESLQLCLPEGHNEVECLPEAICSPV
jgi:hypothetical protein